MVNRVLLVNAVSAIPAARTDLKLEATCNTCSGSNGRDRTDAHVFMRDAIFQLIVRYQNIGESIRTFTPTLLTPVLSEGIKFSLCKERLWLQSRSHRLNALLFSGAGFTMYGTRGRSRTDTQLSVAF